MGREEQNKLKEMLKFEISWLERQTRINDGTCHGLHLWFKLNSYKIALEALEAEPVAYMTYKGYLIHAGDPKLKEYSDPTPLYNAPPVKD